MKNYIILLMSLFSFIACEEESVKEPLELPATYDSPAFTSNAATELAVTSQLIDLTNEMKKGRVTGAKVDGANLTNLYTTGSPSLRSVSNTYYVAKVEAWIPELSKASGNTYKPGTPSGDGGAWNSYLFDENGLELEQMIEKGSFGAVLYKHATDLLNGSLTPATVDKVIAILGTNPSFPSSNDATKHANPDKNFAVYAARRDKNDGAGFYSTLKNAFIALKAALEAGDKYKEEQNEAIGTIKNTWEKINAATAIFYCHSVTSTLSATNPTEAQQAGALHSYGEAVGFIHGWRNLPQTDKIITDAQIDEILTLFNAPASGIPTSYLFVTDPVNQLPKLQQVITKLKSIYQFSDQQIEDFKKNWVSEQKR